VLELIQAGGWLMVPILLCSVIAMAIIIERFWTLQKKRVAPAHLVVQAWQWTKSGHLTEERMRTLRTGSPLGRILAAGLANRHHSRELMKESIREVGQHVVHQLERYLNTLGTIIGMIKVFAVITAEGVGDPAVLASGISEALITTAAGLSVAIPSLMFYRYFRGRVDGLVVSMEQESLKMIEALQGLRKIGPIDRKTGEAA
jgi:biopolymer transport protein ExbB